MYNADSVVESAVDVAFPDYRRKRKYLSYFISFEIADLEVCSCYSIALSCTSQLRGEFLKIELLKQFKSVRPSGLF